MNCKDEIELRAENVQDLLTESMYSHEQKVEDNMVWYSVVWYITISWKICSAEKWHPVDFSFVINTEISPKLGNLLRKQKGLADAGFLLATRTLCNHHKHLDVIYDGILRANQNILPWAQWPHQLEAESLFDLYIWLHI